MTQSSSDPLPNVAPHGGSESGPGGEEALSTRRLYDGAVVKLRADRVRMANGHEVTREVVEHSGAVTIVAVDAAGRVLLVSQHRYPTGRALLELPAGTLEPGEDPLACAVRELEEETGFRAGRIERLGGFFVAPGYCTEYIHVYLATNLEPGTPGGDEDEDIEVRPMPLEEVLGFADTGELEDAKSLASLLLYLRREGAR